MPRVVLDIETCGVLALPKVGAAAYFEDPDTQVTCASYAIDDGPVQRWCQADPPPRFPADATFVAHNYLFEMHGWELALAPRYGWQPAPPLEAWSCLMARALYHALPASLEAICEALNLAIKKDITARDLMLRMARPRSTDPLTWWHETDPEKLADLLTYCTRDTAAERLLDTVLPELSPRERWVFEVDGRMNRKGLLLDTDLVRHMTDLADRQLKRLDTAMHRLTDGVVRTTAQVSKLQAWLAHEQDCPVPDLRKFTVQEALAAVPQAPAMARSALLLRQEAARASTKKLQAMVAGRSGDGRLRGLFQYGGAGRTLRWAGRRVQPQNFPRGTIKNTEAALAGILHGADPEGLAAPFEDSVLGVLASCLRGCFIAAPDHRLVAADLAQIEARVVCWLAGQQDVLDVLASGEDVYRYVAGQQGSKDRQLGKVLVLACGFGMGPPKFQATALTYGVTLDLSQATRAVYGWRNGNAAIVEFWHAISQAARDLACAGDGDSRVVGRILLLRTKQALRIRLPSGRDMIYHQIRVTLDEQGRDNLVFMGVDPKTKRWSPQRTYGGKLVENIVQAVARDVMTDSMLILDEAGIPLVGTVHDELLAEVPEADAVATRDLMLEAMRRTPVWAPGLPTAAEGWIGVRYRKA